jgi:hypothetical protein
MPVTRLDLQTWTYRYLPIPVGHALDGSPGGRRDADYLNAQVEQHCWSVVRRDGRDLLVQGRVPGSWTYMLTEVPWTESERIEVPLPAADSQENITVETSHTLTGVPGSCVCFQDPDEPWDVSDVVVGPNGMPWQEL